MKSNLKLFSDKLDTFIGRLFISVNEEDRLILLGINKHQDFIYQYYSVPANGKCDKIKIQLLEYFSGKRKHFSLEFSFPGATAFQIKVWKSLLTIPYGQTSSYGDVTKIINNKKGYRAVGNAVGKNRIPIIIPCHRVIKSSGKIGGFTGGIDKKIALLNLEEKFK